MTSGVFPIDPAYVAQLQAWGVTQLESVPDYAEVWWARRGSAYVMVKAGDQVARTREYAALERLGERASTALEFAPQLGLLLTERLLPGDDIRPLARRDDDAATREIALLVTAMHGHVECSGELPPLRDIGSAFENPSDPRIPGDIVREAAARFRDLVRDDVDEVVLHGDLHHMNVVNAAGTWKAIDPHGWMGDPTFEAAAFLATPRGLVEGGDSRGMDGTDLARRTRRRAAIYSEVTGRDRNRVLDWAFVGAVIAELWMVAHHDLVHGASLALAQSLRSTRP